MYVVKRSFVISLFIMSVLGWIVFRSFVRLETAKKLQFLNQSQKFILVWGTSQWTILPSEINFSYDIDQTIDRGLPSFTLDQQLLNDRLASISAYINLPAQESEVGMFGQQIVVSRGENGLQVEIEALKQKMYQAASSLNFSPIEIPTKQINPKLNDNQVQFLFDKAKKYLNKKIKLTLLDKQIDLDPAVVVSWIGTNGWKKDKISNWVLLLAPTINTPPQNALFRFIAPNKVEEFLPGKDGIKINEAELTETLLKNLDTLENIPVPYQKIASPITTESVNNLGIKELLGHGESYYSDSIANREFNVAKAASIINGLLIPPGETFSFNNYVGDISAETGYKQAYIIKEGKTVLGDGGGVCQVSSTLFRAALAAGLPIEERVAHAYRVHYYEEKSQVGLDATVFAPSVDFKFKNDTKNYILIQSNNLPTQKKLIFDIYGTSDGRIATIGKSRVWDVAAPPPDLYVDDPTLAKGVVKQVDWSAWGAKAAFDWKVIRGDEVLQERTFYSNYKPWQAIYLRGIR